jgi:hypothetical protein
MHMLKRCFVFALASAITLGGCSSSGGSGGNGGNGGDDYDLTTGFAITGTITVADSSDWDTLKLGIFSADILGTYSELEPHYRLTNAVDNGRCMFAEKYYSNMWGEPVALESLSGVRYTIAGDGNTKRTYFITLPNTRPDVLEEYVLVAWLDEDNDNMLDLTKCAPFYQPTEDDYRVAMQGCEFNRVPHKQMLTEEGISTQCMIGAFGVDYLNYDKWAYTYKGIYSGSYKSCTLMNEDDARRFDINLVPDEIGW